MDKLFLFSLHCVWEKKMKVAIELNVGIQQNLTARQNWLI